jgi:hypothetical protein
VAVDYQEKNDVFKRNEKRTLSCPPLGTTQSALFPVPRWRGCHAVTGVDKTLKTSKIFAKCKMHLKYKERFYL